MTETILCVYASMFDVCISVNRRARVRGSFREVYTQCMCVYVYTTRTCNMKLHPGNALSTANVTFLKLRLGS